MATKSVTPASIGTYAFQYVWSPLLNGDDGAKVDTADLADITFQVIASTFGAGGTVILEGSCDGGVTWFPLKDPSSTAISKTSAGGSAVLEHCQFTRARCTGGDGTTAINCLLFARRVGR
jgi:hypothetical protein